MIRKESKDKIGKQFGKLKVLDVIPRPGGLRPLYKCQCECGEIYVVSKNILNNGEYRRCSCTIKESPPSWKRGRKIIWTDEKIDYLQELLNNKKATNWGWVISEFKSRFNKSEPKELLQCIAYKNRIPRPYMKWGGSRKKVS